MKIGIIIVLALIASGFAAHFLLADPGYVAINFRGYLVEMSVPVLVFLTATVFVAIWLVRKILVAPRRIGEAAGRYRSARSGQKMTRGLIEMAEGNFARGERMLARAASTSDSPLFNYLQAARAAHLQGKNERRDEWLRLAYQDIPEAANAVLLTQAEFQLDQGQHEQALATLRRLDENSKDHGHALALMGRLYYRLQDWPSLRELLPRIRKHSHVKTETLALWEQRVHREEIDKASDPDMLTAAWKAVPRVLKKDLSLLEAYYRALMRTDQHARAEKELASALKSEWRSPLVRLFGIVDGVDASKQLKRAEVWLGTHSEDPDLLLAAARLCLRNELWGKARSYLETVITLRPSPEVYQEYGALLNQLGETDAAADAFRDGLGMVSTATNLPAITHTPQD
ncbi:MAG TPA: heme biosynthesis HemY N-terminal domain-containing protein [Woeseiaceae bacterium]|nr:heme biosynthesis HemY N-terminal domain-containing protein [Woeseiaceae bacterium]